ncbi:MAG: DNA mismatch endonuclease Vsr [Akkermansia sp.]|nr:DNA mismatch endonuclease Vsr [Akkermansia sp.]
MDNHTLEQRRRNMSAVKSKNTKPEILVRKVLHAMGYRFRLHVKELPGKPDIVLPKYKTVIFVNGCFWHRHEGCKYASTPTTNIDFWNAKFAENVARDKKKCQEIQEKGWQVIVIWTCEINNTAALGERLKMLLESK